MVGDKKENFEILIIFNLYKDTLDNFIDSSDLEFLDWARPINIRFYNTLKSKASSADILERDYVNKNFLDKSS